ncbi:hypothetical protein ACQJBY_024242 [Aegilops geniculata]
MVAGLLNSIVWVLYSLAVLRRDRSVDLIMSNLCSLMSNLHCLVFFYAHRRQNLKGYFVVAMTLFCVFGIFVLQQVDPDKPMGIEIFFGALGCFTQLACHFYQIIDLLGSSAERVELISVLLNVIPNTLLGVVSIVITYLRHREQLFMNISGFLNLICYVLEFILILRMCDRVKNFFGSKRKGDTDGIQMVNLGVARDTQITIPDPTVSSQAFFDHIRALRNGQETLDESMGV